jgi:hypothetical protein
VNPLKRIAILLLLSASLVWGQKHELGFTLGATAGTISDALNVSASSGRALQANYAYRFVGNRLFALSGEINLLANPLRTVDGAGSLTKDFASLYLTPGLRVKLLPKSFLSPYGVVGGGYSLYEQSTETIDGSANSAPRHLNTGAFVYGGGLDVRVLRWLALRGEVRDFYTGRPALNLATLSGGQHNIVASAGFVLRFGD